MRSGIIRRCFFGLLAREAMMARHYSIKSFFRQVPNLLLARYFEERGVFADLD